MQPTYPAEALEYREKIQAFLSETLPSDWRGIGALDGQDLHDFVESWRTTLYEHDLLAPGWPKAYAGLVCPRSSR